MAKASNKKNNKHSKGKAPVRRPGKNTFKPEGTHRVTPVNAAPNPTTKEPSVSALRPLKADSFFLHGRHAVLAALQNKKRECIRLIGTEKALSDNILRNTRPDIKTQITDGRTIDQSLMSDSPHQGIILEVRPLPALDLNDVEAMHYEAATVLILDQVTDPHNVGACLRSAAALGACAVVTMDKNSPKESGVLARSASGALDSIPWIRVTNLSQALDTLAELGFWRLGLDGATDKEIGSLKMGSKVAIVMGSEGKGLRPLVKKHCDVLGKIPMTGRVESLNVSNAAAIALFQYGTIGSE